ncbi:MAG: MBL fold metallo-hydrolase [Deltaproteobacteria bacterium]|nr:MBL fold metallo-hydrolase [Deltaproteobacteria bacterium]
MGTVTELSKGVYWVGVVDWDLRHFHGHELSTHRGSTYNSYLIVDEKIVLVDTVWTPFAEQLVENIRQVVDPARIDYVVTNHAEVDHAGSLPAVMRIAPQAEMLVSPRGMETVPGHHHQPWKLRAVKTGETLALGEGKLAFIEAPMLHWPDSMFTYYTARNLLLPNDAFGQHYATAHRFNDQVDERALYEEALKYYANILTPFSKLVSKKIEEVLALGLPVDMIAPSHGVIWRKDPLQIVRKYQEWAAQKPEPRAVVIYDTMWEATRKMAEAIGRGLVEGGVPYRMFHLSVSDRNDVLTEIFRSRAVIIGSPTLNNGVLPTIMPILEDLRGLKFQNKLGAAFGSYGWSGESTKAIEEHLGRCRIPVVAKSVLAKWQPDAAALAACEEQGRTVAKAVREG